MVAETKTANAAALYLFMNIYFSLPLQNTKIVPRAHDIHRFALEHGGKFDRAHHRHCSARFNFFCRQQLAQWRDFVDKKQCFK